MPAVKPAKHLVLLFFCLYLYLYFLRPNNPFFFFLASGCNDVAL